LAQKLLENVSEIDTWKTKAERMIEGDRQTKNRVESKKKEKARQEEGYIEKEKKKMTRRQTARE